MTLPFVAEFLAAAGRHASVERAMAALRPGAGRQRLAGLTATARALVLAIAAHALKRPMVAIVPDARRLEAIVAATRFFWRALGTGSEAHAESQVVTLPALDVTPWQGMSPHAEIAEARAVALWRFATGQAQVLIAPAASALLRVRDAAYYAGLGRTLEREQAYSLEEFLAHVAAIGYERHDTVEMPGQFAVRGGIVDIFSPETPRPVRMEFFGDSLESLREFDPATQRSIRALERATLLPAQETLRRGEESAAGDADAVRAPATMAWEFAAMLRDRSQNSILDLREDAAVVLEEPPAIVAASAGFWQRVQESAPESRDSGSMSAVPQDFYFTPEELDGQIAQRAALSLEHLPLADVAAATELLELRTQPTVPYHGQIAAFMTEIRGRLTAGEQAIACAANLGELERMADLCHEYELAYRLGETLEAAGPARLTEDASAGSVPALTLLRAPLSEGVVFPDLGLTIYGTNDLFETVPAAERPKRRPRTASFFSDFSDLRPGDYVVHVDHGIGQFDGLRTLDTDGGGELMLLRYADDAKLYVPLARLDLVQKYQSVGGAHPSLDKLGGTAWTARKQRVRKSVADMADKLLRLYAERKSSEGYSFGRDTEWQREFEDAFEFDETPDQARAIEDVKRDMEKNAAMDRLLCGDVGYGKTEVAMRAAFKALGDQKQVAVLAPTTVLAFQHFETFRRRFAAFPIRVEMLSRFRTAKEQKAVLADLEAGKVDVVIGTHRLLSKDVQFHDLGLLIVDEEQRFGVAHKERIKELRRNVDVLVMSATPIPRTLHMSLVGLRDMSVIETPPKDRMAIQTVVAPFSERMVQSAIEAELAREGQVYFVHNRVESIYSMAALVQRLVPRARVLVGHGQMGERELERVMLAFMRHEADVLVATTIIENGLDIPRCNTILINRADRLGLSELYQLRGRVGRSNLRAYAYLLVPTEGSLPELARKRLAALREFSDLGAGFRIAALDLELRGAGNLLGAEQHGHVNAVGFDMYTRMLERAVAELKGEAVQPELRATLNLGLDIRIPPEYIPGENLRLRMYKRIAGVTSEEERAEVAQELADRFGPVPGAVESLLDYAVLKALCERVLVASIERRGEQLAVKFHEQTPVEPQSLVRVVRSQRGMRLDPSGVLWMEARSGRHSRETTGAVKSLLLQLQT